MRREGKEGVRTEGHTRAMVEDLRLLNMIRRASGMSLMSCSSIITEPIAW